MHSLTHNRDFKLEVLTLQIVLSVSSTTTKMRMVSLQHQMTMVTMGQLLHQQITQGDEGGEMWITGHYVFITYHVRRRFNYSI